MRKSVKRVLVALGLLALAFAIWAGWEFGHPAMAATETLPVTTTPGQGLIARYFGTTTLVFSDGRNAVMVDALLTRPSMKTAVFGKVASDSALVDRDLKQAEIGRIDLLLISHSHYDHVLDAAAVAKRTGAIIIGSRSTEQVAIGGDIAPDRIVTVNGGEQFSAGDFHVTVLRSRHSLPVTAPGAIVTPLVQPAKLGDFREGGTFAFLIEHKGYRILVHASANFEPGMYRHTKADAVFLATGGLAARPADFTQAYWHEVVEQTGAKLVVPIHWDDFWLPLDQPLQPLRRFLDNIPGTMKRIALLAARDHVAVRYMPVIAPVELAP